MKKYILFLLVMLNMLTGHAQLPLLNSGRMAGQEMTCKAVENALYVSKSNYRLKSKFDGKFYGRDGKKDFGVGYAVAFKTREGIVMLSSQIMSWNNEDDFQKVSSEYDAVLSSLELLKLDNSEPISVNRPTQFADQYQIVDSQSNGGLEIISQTGDINGWCVWITTQSKSDELTAVDVMCQANTKSIFVTDSIKTVDAGNVPQGVRVLGGIYVCPKYEEGGVIRYCVAGILDNTFGKWNIVLPFNSNVNKKLTVSEVEAVEETTGNKLNITPVEEDLNETEAPKKGKKKKSKKQDCEP